MHGTGRFVSVGGERMLDRVFVCGNELIIDEFERNVTKTLGRFTVETVGTGPVGTVEDIDGS